MATRKDQLHSYQFMLQRSISALVMRETDPQQAPLRRGVGAAFAGVMVAVILMASFGIYGLLTKSGVSKWQQPNSIVVERETGATFVYLDGKLTPTLNLTSARLIAGAATKSLNVSRNSLKRAPRAGQVGIPGAPQALPAASRVTGPNWSMCALGKQNDQGGDASQTVLLIGRSDGPGTELGRKGLLVQDEDPLPGEQPQIYLIWNGFRHLIGRETLRLLYVGVTTYPTETRSWIDAVPEGEPIVPIDLSGRGERSRAVPGFVVGDVLRAEKSNNQYNYYVVNADGIAPITNLLIEIYKRQADVPFREVRQSTVDAMPSSRRQYASGGSPEESDGPTDTPELVPSDQEKPLCVEYTDRDPTPKILVDAKQLSPDLGAPTKKSTDAGAVLADRVAVEQDRIAVVRTRESGGAYSLISDNGKRYPVQSAELLGTLGYTPQQAVEMPAAIVNRIPTGPTLSVAAAKEAA
jgi:type VII secretion protein EccB